METVDTVEAVEAAKAEEVVTEEAEEEEVAAVESEVVEANDPVDPSATAFCASQTGTNGEQPPPPSLLAGARWTGTRCRSLCVSVCCCR